jgi:Zn-dependent protease with chaperone function
MKRLLLLILAFSLLSACATSPTGRKQLMLISPESAIVESQKAYLSTVNDLNKQNKLVDDPKVVDRVATITGRLVTEAVRVYPNSKNWKWSVAIINDPNSKNWKWSVAIIYDPETVNAWGMAGRRMAVYTGLFEKLHLTDAEFAQIMGHEISHALANHTAERMSRAMATTLGVVVIGVMSDKPGVAMGGAAAAATVALTLPNSRTAGNGRLRPGCGRYAMAENGGPGWLQAAGIPQHPPGAG